MYLGHVRAALDDPFWDTPAGRTLFRMLSDEIAEEILRHVFSLAREIDQGADPDIVRCAITSDAEVHAGPLALADLMLTSMVRAAIVAREPEVPPGETDQVGEHAKPP